jgi:1,4-alpha-glucan branching enzyme
VLEHPYYASWGYQTTGYFAATSRYGAPQDLMRLVDRLHQHGIGVILDWVPSHFPADEHGLVFFDGTHLYEYEDPRLGYHRDWKSYVFDYGRPEVRSFLVSSALFWLDRYHMDGLRVDGVASMLYRDYSRPEGEWLPNVHGGKENLEAIGFLRQLNEAVHEHHPGTFTIAEESTAWPMVSRPSYVGGLGFDMKWDMGWMHDTLRYLGYDPVFRKFHHGALTFRMMYAFSESFVLALSHDEVVHGKRSLVRKMHGDAWQRMSTLRALYGYMWGLPGKKLLFMGGEIGAEREWDHDSALDWSLLEDQRHAGLYAFVAALNRLYRAEPALHATDFEATGFRWIDCSDAEQSVVVFVRGRSPGLVVVLNLTPVARHNYRVGLPAPGIWRERLNSDAAVYGGSGLGNPGPLVTVPIAYHGEAQSVPLTLPPLSALFLEHVEGPVRAPGAVESARG